MNDLRFAFRQLTKSPGFTAVAILTVALGIGACTAVFSLVNDLLIRPLPYQAPQELVLLWQKFSAQGLDQIPVSAPEYLDYEKQTTSFEHIAAFDYTDLNLTGRDMPERIQGAVVAPSLFPLLGVGPMRGRVFTNDEFGEGRDGVVILSARLWQRRFGADRGGWDAKSGYRGSVAQARSEQRASRPKARKLDRNPELREVVEDLLRKKYSPEQIAGSLPKMYPDRPEMRVTHETIYKYFYDRLYVQGRGELRRELSTCLRTGRVRRKPRKRTSATETRGRITGMINIAERPPEADDRAVPGHWEGDLIIGKNSDSQIGTLVERSSGFVGLLHLPEDRTADVVAEEMIRVIKALPEELRRTLTWDQGKEMAEHARISIDAGIDIYFCDPHSPWQRGSNENTNGLLRQYFPKGTDLSLHSAEYLAEVAAELNNRPRKRFDFDSPAQVLDRLLSNPPNVTVASKP